MIIIIPIGGIGQRFKENGYEKPKALINIYGKSIISYLLDNLNTDNIDYIFIPYNKEYKQYRFEDLLIKNYPNIHFKFYCLENNTRVPYQHYTNAIEGYFNVLKSRLQKKKGLTYNELVNNVKGVLGEIPIHIYKNLIKGAYDRNEKYVKLPSTRKRKPKKYLD